MNVTNEIISEFYHSEFVDGVTNQLIEIVILIASLLAVFLYLITLGWNYLKSGFESLTGGNKGSIINYEELMRTIILVICIFSYKPIATTLADTIDYFNSLSAPKSTQMENLQKYMTKMYDDASMTENEKKVKLLEQEIASGNLDPTRTSVAQEEINKLKSSKDNTTENVNKAAEDSEMSTWEWMEMYMNPDRWGSIFITGIASTLTAFVKIIVGLLAVFIFKFLLIVGPLAFAFSILPTFRSKLDEWFGTLLGTGFVFTTLNILDHFSFQLMSTVMGSEDFNQLDQSVVTIVNSLLIVLYLMAFWLTSKYVGKGDGGRFVTKSLQLATVAAVAAMSGGAGAAAGAGTSGTNSQIINAANAAGDAFKDES